MVKCSNIRMLILFNPLEMLKNKICALAFLIIFTQVVIGAGELQHIGISTSDESTTKDLLFNEAVLKDVSNSGLGQEERKSCPYPAYPIQGAVTFSSDDRTVGTTAIYSCNEGYNLSGKSTRTCLSSGRWSGDIPDCIFSSLKNGLLGISTSDGSATKDISLSGSTLNEDLNLESDCHCINANCVTDGGYVECVCYPDHGKYSFNECKECNCGAGFNCSFDPDLYDDNKKCLCTDGYSDVNGTCIGPCTGDPCLNGGTCVASDGRFYCQCKSGYFGDICQDKGACADEPCFNGGMCMDINDEYHCICQRGYSGRNCEIGAFVNVSTDDPHTIVEWDSTTVIYDSSTVRNTSYPPECDCGPKSTDCSLNTSGKHLCYCISGYSQIGNICSDCYCGDQSVGCNFDEEGSKKCLCAAGYSQKDGICRATCKEDNECLNRGNCLWDRINGRFCACTRNFKGDWCEINVICELLNPSCMVFGAVCKTDGNSAKCECPPNKVYQWETGKCENICDSRKCVYGACVVVGLDYKCICDEGYAGLRCEQVAIQARGNISFWIPIVVGTNAITLLILLGTCIYLCRNRSSKQNTV